MHIKDQGYIAKLGFADLDKRNNNHDLACRYLAQKAKARKVLKLFDWYNLDKSAIGTEKAKTIEISNNDILHKDWLEKKAKKFFLKNNISQQTERPRMKLRQCSTLISRKWKIVAVNPSHPVKKQDRYNPIVGYYDLYIAAKDTSEYNDYYEFFIENSDKK